VLSVYIMYLCFLIQRLIIFVAFFHPPQLPPARHRVGKHNFYGNGPPAPVPEDLNSRTDEINEKQRDCSAWLTPYHYHEAAALQIRIAVPLKRSLPIELFNGGEIRERSQN